MSRDKAEQMFDQQMRNLRYAATIVEGRDRPDRDDIAESCRWAESRLRHYRERDAALSSAPPDLELLRKRKRAQELALYAFRHHGDDAALYNALADLGGVSPDGAGWLSTLDVAPAPPVAETPECAGPFVSAFDCPKCDPRRPPASPVVAPAPVVETVTVTLAQLQGIEAEGYIDYGIGGCPECKQESGKDHQVDCWIGNGIVALSPRETPDGGGR